ncbi:E3 ubiquitin-protein ligase COP1 [Jatropha curcas]|uniref:E3 ubiquitin-protein ligase COP1 n=1 Tax=Jatropha curcas TaxID=180498 RepID=UPI001895C8E5|nr:E3 ubiquitin-protein ligase COP1 [Jatropha curcas]
MEEVSTGAIVPAVKFEPKPSSSSAAAETSAEPSFQAAAAAATVEDETGLAELDKDFLCPICMQIIKDAFLTACGHSFCYMCIITHLRNKNDCPCCGHYLTSNQLFPNFLLQKLLKKASARQTSKNASPVERFRQALQQGCEISIKELETLMSLAMLCSGSKIDKNSGGMISSSFNARGGMTAGNLPMKKMDGKAQGSHGLQRKDTLSGSDSQYNQSGLSVVRKKRIHAQFNDLQDCYLQKRRQLANQPHNQQERDKNVIHREGYSAGLADFQSVLSTFTQYSRLRVVAELRHGDLFHSANIVSSIEFDRDDELFATAGVSRRIKVFDFSTVLNDPADVHCPVVEMSAHSKLSCLSWNKYAKNQIASSDYEGVVNVWDVTTRQSVMEYEEHEKRAWSVDFSRTEPSMLVSGSDDCKVKVWCTNQEASVLNIDMTANICCVKYNPGSSNYIAVGSADHHIHYYDLRNISHPLHVFSGHRKAVSYVKFLSNNELASASTDSTLRLWDVKENVPVRTFRGHTNEKNFVGLSVNHEYIACGSETNEVFVYHKEISKPVTWHRFGSPEMDDTDEDAASYFISAVCWKSNSPTMLTANSQGTIKVLVLAA